MNTTNSDFICHSTDLMNSHRCVVGVLTPSADLSTLSASMPRTHVVAEVKVAVRSAAALIRSSRFLTAFTGAGISVENGIPPFRGPGGLWSRYDPRMLELDYFLAHPDRAWPVIREIFYDHFGKAKPNEAHEVLARLAAWEAPGAGAPGGSAGTPSSDDAGLDGRGRLRVLITQNIDNLHCSASCMARTKLPR
jgi:hypothetical protein